MYNVMKYKIIFIIIIIIIIIGLISYNNNIYEKFINDNKDKVTDICNVRQKLDLEVCNNKNIKGDPGERGDIGRIGSKGVKGDKGNNGDNGMNGKHAYCIGNFIFKDDENETLSESKNNCDDTYNKLVDKETIVTIPNGNPGNNARMNPIIFVDMETGEEISKQYEENSDLTSIIIEIEKGDKGDTGKHAIQVLPSDTNTYDDKIICNTLGNKGSNGTQGPIGNNGIDNTNNGTKGPRGYTGQIIDEPHFDTLNSKTVYLIHNENEDDKSIFRDLCSYITNDKIKKINEIIKSELEHMKNSRDEIDKQSSFSQPTTSGNLQRECNIYE